MLAGTTRTTGKVLSQDIDDVRLHLAAPQPLRKAREVVNRSHIEQMRHPVIHVDPQGRRPFGKASRKR